MVFDMPKIAFYRDVLGFQIGATSQPANDFDWATGRCSPLIVHPLGDVTASTGLKVNGKVFAMMVRGKFVAKLPKERVDALVRSGKGERFDPGHGRLMKEWIAVAPGKAPWVELAKEAYRFVR